MNLKTPRMIIALTVCLSIACLFSPAWAENCPEGAISYWKLNETIAGNYIDFIGNHNGTCDNTCPSPESNGVVSNAKTFDGGATGITIPANAAFDWAADDSFSIEMWIKRNGSAVNAGGEVMVGRIDGTTFLEWRIEIRTDRKAAFKLVATNGTGALSQDIAVSSKIIANDQWHHIVAVRDAASNTNILYVDGEVEASVQSLTYDADFSSATAGLNIGWIDDAQGGRLQGTLDEVAIYNRPLTDKEIKSHYYLSRGYCNELDSQITIMPMGDSITKDRLGLSDPRPNAERVGYRQRLYDDLFGNDYWFDLIGSEEDGDQALFDNDHAGWGGIELHNLFDILSTGRNTKVGEEEDITFPDPYLSVHHPEFILLHMGTNDVSNPAPDFPNTEMNTLGQILDEIDTANPQTTVLLAKIINKAPGGNNQGTIDFNAAVDTLAQNRILNGDKIIVVDMEQEAGLIYTIDSTNPYNGGDFIDDTHPNPAGYPKMGSHWFSVLDTILPKFQAPTITSAATDQADVDSPYTFTVTVSGTAPFAFSLENAPSGMTINPSTGVIDWTPDTIGTYDFTIKVQNTMPFSATGEDTQVFTLDVTEALVITGQTTLSTPFNQPISIELNNLTVDGADPGYPTGYSLTLFDGPDYSVNNNQVVPDSQFSGDLSVPVKIDNATRESNVFNLTVNVQPQGNTGGGGGGGGGGCFIGTALMD